MTMAVDYDYWLLTMEESVKSVVLKYTGVLLKHKSGRLDKAYLTV